MEKEILQQKICYPNIEEDEIDLRELWQTIKKGKKIIFLTFFVSIFLTLIYLLSTPNIYEVKTTLLPQNQKKTPFGSFSSLASFAGIYLRGGEAGADRAFLLVLENYEFMKKFILKHNLQKKVFDENNIKNYHFAFGFDKLYRLIHIKKSKKNDTNSLDEEVFNTYKQIKDMIKISTDKKTSIITISSQHPNPYLAKEVLELFLTDASRHLISNNLKYIDSKLKYYNSNLNKIQDISLKKELAKLISSLIQQKVIIQSSKYYNVKQITKPYIPYYKDKIKPKRALILIVAAVTSLILGVFLV